MSCHRCRGCRRCRGSWMHSSSPQPHRLLYISVRAPAPSRRRPCAVLTDVSHADPPADGVHDPVGAARCRKDRPVAAHHHPTRRARRRCSAPLGRHGRLTGASLAWEARTVATVVCVRQRRVGGFLQRALHWACSTEAGGRQAQQQHQARRRAPRPTTPREIRLRSSVTRCPRRGCCRREHVHPR